MAKKSILGNTYTYKDLFDTQEALDTGELGNVLVPVTTTSTYQKKFLGMNVGSPKTVNDLNADKLKAYSNTPDSEGKTFASILGQSEAIAANKKRKEEQKLRAQQGFGTSQSILGGSAF